ncbi:MAG TPA: methyltransferase type 12 [Cyanobacteria bacterium UBA8803]|nr:methyltransferase type 12 [Cyanobacteria bacterium UBA9273]HBL59569.1 methyltransferase type 12 [Cyanobacteria bacterium UBA8803]
MIEVSSNPNPRDNSASSQLNSSTTREQRLDCLMCNYHIEQNNESAFATFSCNVRAFQGEKFKVWRCPSCQTIHCLDVVDLPHYYAKYPVSQGTLTWPYRICYGNLCGQLKKFGFSKTSSFLDYGCANGLFVNYLRQRGFVNCHGYDPYAPQEGFGNPATLKQKPFDYILLQEVIEHVEDPHALLRELDSLLAPSGYILISTPDAANLDLTKPEVPDFYNYVHVPYHLHIYTREGMELLGRSQGWELACFFERQYHDTPWFSLNSRAWNQYVLLLDGAIDVIYEPIKTWKALTSYKYLFYAAFGYWLSYENGMSVMFKKTGF